MDNFSIEDLKTSTIFLEKLQWEITPKTFMKPKSALSVNEYEKQSENMWYMLYVDLINDKPSLMIMKNRGSISQTVGYIDNVPDDLLREAMNCSEGDCTAGMYPLTKKLTDWLKKALGLV